MPSSPLPNRRPDRAPARFSHRLLAWWDRHGRKSLPWQEPRDPYRVWVSEIMLQQTQVSSVIPYFERWMSRLPDVPTLARAPLDEVLALWSGLGYYARARNLHAAAKICCEAHDGKLPQSADDLAELPGIGPSTANAIISLAFDRPAAVLDGNVKRVIARHAGIEGWPGTSSVQKALWREARARLPQERAADYSQAVMDLGALVCTRRNPGCTECPVRDGCRAATLGATDRIPAARPRKKVPSRTVHMLVIRDDQDQVLLQRRPPDGIWGGLWSLPEGETRAAAQLRAGLDGFRPAEQRSLPDIEHRLTHLHLRIRPTLMTVTPPTGLQCPQLRETPDMAWFSAAARRDLGLPKPVNELLKKLR